MQVEKVTSKVAERVSAIERDLIRTKGQLQSAARQALAAAGEIQVLLELLQKIESQGN